MGKSCIGNPLGMSLVIMWGAPVGKYHVHLSGMLYGKILPGCCMGKSCRDVVWGNPVGISYWASCRELPMEIPIQTSYGVSCREVPWRFMQGSTMRKL